MNQITLYLVELNIAITIFWLVYILVFQKDANFNLRRTFLIYAIVISAIIPFMHFSFQGNTISSGIAVFSIDEVVATASGNQFAAENPVNLFNIIATIYTTVSAYFLIRLLFGLVLIIKTKFTARKHIIHGSIVYESSTLHASSFFNLIFINPDKIDRKETEHIVQHEQHHARLYHSFDRILMEMVLIMAWVNPITWLVRKAIIINHEYQADNRMIEQGTDQVSYQLSILNQYIGSASITNQFSTHIKNRIVMLNKNYKKGSFWKSMVLLPVSIVLLFFIACNNEDAMNDSMAENESIKTDTYYSVDEMPQWPGSEEELSIAIRKFIARNLQYPAEAASHNVQGKVMVTFMVTKTGDVVIPEQNDIPPAIDKDGKLGEVVAVGLNSLKENSAMDEVVVTTLKQTEDDKNSSNEKYISLLEKEGKRIIDIMPDLVPGKKDGKPVNVIFTIPINFVLQ